MPSSRPCIIARSCAPFPLFLDASSHLYKRVCPSVRPSVRPLVGRPVGLSVHPLVRWSVRPSVRPSVGLSVRPSARPSIRLSVRPSHTSRNRAKSRFLTKIAIDKCLKQESMTILATFKR